MAPTVSLEQLAYATRLMNVASAEGAQAARKLRDWFVKSDDTLDPQAYVLRPDVVVQLSSEIISEKTPYLRTRRAAIAMLELLRRAYSKNAFPLANNELRWLDKLSKAAEGLPAEEDEFIAYMRSRIDSSKVRLDEYGL